MNKSITCIDTNEIEDHNDVKDELLFDCKLTINIIIRYYETMLSKKDFDEINRGAKIMFDSKDPDVIAVGMNIIRKLIWKCCNNEIDGKKVIILKKYCHKITSAAFKYYKISIS